MASFLRVTVTLQNFQMLLCCHTSMAGPYLLKVGELTSSSDVTEDEKAGLDKDILDIENW